YSFHFLFLLLRLPPTSTLFPYTTLFRSTRFNAISKNLDLLVDSTQILNIPPAAPMPEISGPVQPLSSQLAEWIGNKSFGRESGRSEEHTSELQSLAYLVCRLLLEKKKQK